MTIYVENFNQKVPMYFLGDTIKTPQKFCLFLYEKSNRVNTIDPPVYRSAILSLVYLLRCISLAKINKIIYWIMKSSYSFKIVNKKHGSSNSAFFVVFARVFIKYTNGIENYTSVILSILT